MLNKPDSFEFSLANCGPKDIEFLKQLVQIFADPANAQLLEHVRAGDVVLHMHPENGNLCMLPITDCDRQPLPFDVVRFVGRFSDIEWENIVADKGRDTILALARQNVSIAEAAAREVLGYLPSPIQQLQLANG